MRTRRVCVAALLSVVLAPASAFAATYYASPDGSGDGTSESSPASVSAAADNAQHALARFAHPLVRWFDPRTRAMTFPATPAISESIRRQRGRSLHGIYAPALAGVSASESTRAEWDRRVQVFRSNPWGVWGRIFSPRGCNDPGAEEETLLWQAPGGLAQ